jgi:hypothetical protein
MALLARAQSLSGRGYDALVMLQRLADAGVIVDDADTSEDFRRARDYPQWPELLERMTTLRAKADASRAAGTPPPAEPKPKAPASTALNRPANASAPPVTPAPPAESAPPAAAPDPIALALPAPIQAPAALAHDAVSARFVLADADSDLLRVVSETSGNATNLVTTGWSGGAVVTAVAIDRRTGNLWVAGSAEKQASLYRLQLISGRLLETFSVADKIAEARFVAVAVGPNGVFALDATHGRIFTIQRAGKTLDVLTRLPAEIKPTGLALSGSMLYVAHTTGILRVDPVSKGRRALTASNAAEIADMHSLAWHDGALLGIRQGSAPVTVRVRLNSTGTAATAVDVFGPAASHAAVLSGNAYYYLARASDAGLSLRSIPAGK